MKVPTFNMSLGQQMKSRAMILGWCLIAFGITMAAVGLFKAEAMNMDVVKEGGTYVAAGIAIFGIRDKKS